MSESKSLVKQGWNLPADFESSIESLSDSWSQKDMGDSPSPVKVVSSLLNFFRQGNFPWGTLSEIKPVNGSSETFAYKGKDGETLTRSLTGIPIYIHKRSTLFPFSSEKSKKGVKPFADSMDGKFWVEAEDAMDRIREWEHPVPFKSFGMCDDNEFQYHAYVRESYNLFFLIDGARLPQIVRVTPGSYKSWRNFQTGCEEWDRDYWHTRIRISLEPRSNKEKGVDYSAFKFDSAGEISDESDREACNLLHNLIMQVHAEASANRLAPFQNEFV